MITMALQWNNIRFTIFRRNRKILTFRQVSTAPNVNQVSAEVDLLGQKYCTDNWTNITPRIVSKLGVNLHTTQYHPLSLLRQKIVNYFYSNYLSRTGNPVFSIYDNISPIVTVNQNFDSLLVPKDHPSRNKSDCYYINRETLLRAHTTAHQAELISMGLNNFLVIGDVYRRDEIDSTHYPVFHQVDGVRICTQEEVFSNVKGSDCLQLFEHRGVETSEKQACHTLESVKIMEHELKSTLIGLAEAIFGEGVKCRWVEEYFPFTHPSWELEVFHNDKWLEILGCGIMRQEILHKSGTGERIGWAFGLGLERLAMCLYKIPDIRLFWSKDSGFLNQFKVTDPNEIVTYKPVSVYPQCTNDMSFWLPENTTYTPNDFYDIVREIAGDIVEQISLIDVYKNPKTNKTSHCYRIVYRHMERTLTQKEVNDVHNLIAENTKTKFSIVLR